MPRATLSATILAACFALVANAEEPSAWWSLQPLRAAPVPATRHRAANPIDAFIFARLEQAGFAPAPEADRRTLIRRLFINLLGLLPAPEEVLAFQQDGTPSAHERLVDRLLASPRHGERWARHWMDAVHFAETHGHDQDRIREHAWPYRDYLIASFNADKPYARFVEEQIAGDALFPDDPSGVIALGFLAAGPWDESTLRDIREDTLDRQMGRYLDRDDVVTTVMQTFTATTVQCARCHDHKFDPISQQDYYALQAVFAGVERANRRYETDLAIGQKRQALLAALAKKMATLPPALQSTAAKPLADRKSAEQAALAPHGALLKLQNELAALPKPSVVFAAASDFEPDAAHKPFGRPRLVHVLNRGDIRQPKQEAAPGALTCVPGLPARFALAEPGNEAARRVALARWVTSQQNPLTWRVMANRVWHHHFGRGLVETPNDFGKMGAAPSHPKLLDWLAANFLADGGSLKKLHRLIVTSQTYRQSSRLEPAWAAKDANNRLLWRMNPGRLEAETWRDAVLAAAGRMDWRMGGPSDRQFDLQPGIHVTPLVNYTKFQLDEEAGQRRSVYRFLFRTLPDPLMDALDCPAGDQLTATRNASVTVQQALALWNSAFMARHCQHMAERLAKERAALSEQLDLAFETLLSRPPTQNEASDFAAYAQGHGLANACRLLLNSNEFIFVD